MKRYFFFLHPIVIFIFSLLASGTSLFLFLHWYIVFTNNVNEFVLRFNVNPEIVFAPHSWVIIVISSILLVCILFGLAFIFTYYQKSIQLYYLQENFINNFTHELKTPLASIKLYLETFLRHNLPREKQIEFITFMLKDTKRLSDHVQQILLAGGLENRFRKVDLIPVNAEKFFQDFLNNNQHLFKGGDVSFHNSSNKDTTIYLNTQLTEILLMNIISNGLKFTDCDTPKVDINISIINKKVYLRFKDNGVGIRKEDLKNIFKKFYQVKQKSQGTAGESKAGESKVLVRSSKGTGLGLYICKQIMKAQNGQIIAESNGLGHGSTFTLVFNFVNNNLNNVNI